MLLPLAALLTVFCAPLGAQQPVDRVPAAIRLADWLVAYEPDSGLSVDAKREVRELVERALDELRQSAEFERDGALALLDVAGWRLVTPPTEHSFKGSFGTVRKAGIKALEALRRGPHANALDDLITSDVLPLAERHPYARRLVALHLAAKLPVDRVRTALLFVARNEADPLRPHVLRMLPGFADEAIDLFLVGLIGRKFDTRQSPHPFNLLLERIEDRAHPLGRRAADALEARIAAMLISTDWREASRAIEVLQGVEYKQSVPLLIDALSAWTRRDSMGQGSRRIVDEIVRELRRISGRSIGSNPKSWITWWIAVRQGRTVVAAEAPESEAPRTEASFFGLRPVSDRVTFIIDYSGSMETGWGTDGLTRYEEAIEQMMRFLQAAGEETRFNVILFNDFPLMSSRKLIPATADALERARTALLRRTPDGGTLLRPAVELALAMDAEGRVDPELVEADTIVILCDGETASGPGWVRPLLTEIRAETRIRFHCVQLGSNGDGTLERLARGSGGDFIRVGG